MKTYALLGKNIGYSSSPFMHNAAFSALKMDAEYKIFDIPERDLKGFLCDLRSGKIEGCNVTIPYKEKALEFVDEKNDTVEAIGALNTIARKKEKLVADNTDFLGFMKALRGEGEGDLNFDPKGKNIFLFGAGGAAKAIVYVLLTLKAKRIILTDIDKAKAEALAGSFFKKRKGDVSITVSADEEQYEEFISRSNLLINATPCGMKEKDGALFDYRYIEEKHYIFDLIYARKTPLVKDAQKSGARAVDGLNMLLYQAAASFSVWTGREAPLPVMRKALLEHVGRPS